MVMVMVMMVVGGRGNGVGRMIFRQIRKGVNGTQKKKVGNRCLYIYINFKVPTECEISVTRN